MKKVLLGVILGLAAGAVGTFLIVRNSEPPEAKLTAPKKESEEHGIGLHLAKEQQTAAGIVTINPALTEIKTEVKGYGRVLDAAPLAGLFAEIEAARSAATA